MLAAVLLVLLLPALVVANASEWAARTVVDDRTFSTTAGRVMDTPELRAIVADRISGQVVEGLLTDPITARVVATQILGLGADATVGEIDAAIRSRIAVALDDPSVRSVRDAIISDIHAALVGSAMGASGSVRVQGDALVLDTGPFIDRLATAVDGRLTPGLIAIAPADRTIVLVEADAIKTSSRALSLLDLGRSLIPIAAVIVAFAIVGLAHRRVRALGLVGIAVTFGGLVTLAVAWAGGEAIGDASSDVTVRLVATEVYAAFVRLLIIQSALLILVGLLIAVIALAIGRRRQSSRRSTTVAMP